MNTLMLALTLGLLTGLVAGFLIGAYFTLRDHGDLIDDGMRWRAYINELAHRHSSLPVMPAAGPGVRGEARAWSPVIIEGGAR